MSSVSKANSFVGALMLIHSEFMMMTIMMMVLNSLKMKWKAIKSAANCRLLSVAARIRHRLSSYPIKHQIMNRYNHLPSLVVTTDFLLRSFNGDFLTATFSVWTFRLTYDYSASSLSVITRRVNVHRTPTFTRVAICFVFHPFSHSLTRSKHYLDIKLGLLSRLFFWYSVIR